MKKTKKEIAFLIETSQTACQIISKRRYFLRTHRTASVGVVSKRRNTAWLKAVALSGCNLLNEENWDAAHALAELFLDEMSQSVYIEPASKAGRYNALVNGEKPDNNDDVGEDPTSSMASPFGFGQTLRTGFTSSVRSNIGLGSTFGFGGSSPFNPGANILPAQVDAIINRKDALGADVSCPMLYKLSGWEELPSYKQMMFETETAQTIKTGLDTSSVVGDQASTLELVALQPSTSKPLSKFLNQALSKSA